MKIIIFQIERFHTFLFLIDDPEKKIIFGPILVFIKGISSAIYYLRVEYVIEKGFYVTIVGRCSSLPIRKYSHHVKIEIRLNNSLGK